MGLLWTGYQHVTILWLGNKTLSHLKCFLTCVYRWPLLIDSTPQSSTFLRYRDTNFINALNPKHMEPDVIRLAILGGVRFVLEVIHVVITPESLYVAVSIMCYFYARVQIIQCWREGRKPAMDQIPNKGTYYMACSVSGQDEPNPAL